MDERLNERSSVDRGSLNQTYTLDPGPLRAAFDGEICEIAVFRGSGQTWMFEPWKAASHNAGVEERTCVLTPSRV